ncbi:hypothetical protein CPB86DRAFT_782066 [Serendipita vermifera]|nr:hypothetical protein CPB86DRAFT_782066 [Serendipita vermifera]
MVIGLARQLGNRPACRSERWMSAEGSLDRPVCSLALYPPELGHLVVAVVTIARPIPVFAILLYAVFGVVQTSYVPICRRSAATLFDQGAEGRVPKGQPKVPGLG